MVGRLDCSPRRAYTFLEGLYLENPVRAYLPCSILPFFLLAACSSEDTPAAATDTGPVQEISYEVFPFVLSLDEPARNALRESRDDGTLVFDGAPAALADVERGSIVLSGVAENAPHGLLRLVRDVDRTSGTLVLHTVGAPPQLAFRKLHLRASDRISSFTDPANDWQYPSLGPTIKGSGKGREPIDFFLFNGDGDSSTPDDQVRVHGELGGGLEYDVDIDTDWGELDALSKIEDCVGKLLTFGLVGGDDCELPEIKAHLYVTPNAEAKIMFEGAAFKTYEKEYTLASVTVAPGVIPVAPGIVFVVVVDVVARVEGRASSRFAVGASATVKATTGLEYGSLSGVSFVPPVPSFSFAPEGTDVTLSGYAKVSVGPRLSLRLWGVAGPYAELTASASVDADQSRSPCYDVRAGADGEVGFLLTLPGLGTLIDEGKPFQILDESVATGSCKQPPGSSSFPPGAGPDAEHLLNPTFDPWASMYDSPVRAVPHQSNDLAWMDVERSIDGRWIIAGSAVDTLTKVSAGGEVIWAKRYLDPDPPEDTTPQPLLVQRSLPSPGAGLLVVGHPFSLFEIGQGGDVRWAMKFDPGEKVTETGPNGWRSDQRTFTSAVSDGEGGYFLAGSYQPNDDTPSGLWLLHLGQSGAILSSRWFAADRFLYPVQIVAIEGGVLVAGLDWDKVTNYRGLVLAHLGANGTVSWAQRFGACEGFGYPGMQPFDAQRLANGDVLVAGSLDLGRRSFVMEVKPDGQVSWASAQWGDDPLTDMAIHAVRELPTTGFLAAGHYHFHFEPERLFLAGLDAKGRTQWLKVYGQPSKEDGIPAEQKFPSLQLTDDGAALLAAYTTAPVPSQNDNLWVLQAAAKDGAITLQPNEGEVLEFPHATVDCSLTGDPITLAVSPLELAPTSFVPIVEDQDMTVTSQAP
jgi:hypothetical protein